MANRFWVGGTGTWDASTTTHWSASTGGAGGASVPVAGDTVTLDVSSGGGTVTVAVGSANSTISLASLIWGAFTGTIDFTGNNNNLTLTVAGFNGSGSGTRTISLGSGTFTNPATTSPWNMTTTTGLTFNANTSTIVIGGAQAAAPSFNGGGLTYNNLVINGNSSLGGMQIAGANTFSAITMSAPNTLYVPAGTTQSVGTLTFSGGSSSNPLGLLSSSAAVATIALTNAATIDWAAIRALVFTGSSFSATNSFNLGLVTLNGGSITGPAGGSGVHMIGG